MKSVSDVLDSQRPTSTRHVDPTTSAPGLPGQAPVQAGPARGAESNHRAGRSVLVLSMAVVVLFTGLGTLGVLPRLRRAEPPPSASAVGPPAVTATVAVAQRAPADVEQVLPGTALPLFETAIFPRTNGYLVRRLVDFGSIVQAGDLLAEIATPEVDDQLQQARATLAQTGANLERDRANEEYGNIELARVRALVDRKALSQEEYDRQAAATKVAVANVRATEATIKVNEADIRRLTDLQAFEKITAPFSGVITVRNYDAGALMIADNPANQLPMFRLAQVDTLRVTVNVPQVYSTDVHPGQEAKVFRREDPRHEFTGQVTRIASALDHATRTMLTEVQVPNPDGALLPGMYLMVRFVAHTQSPHVIVPVAALVTRGDGVRVAVLDGHSTVRYRDVKLGSDFGAQVEVISGLEGGEQVVVRPGDALAEGTLVRAVPVSPTNAAVATASRRDPALGDSGR